MSTIPYDLLLAQRDALVELVRAENRYALAIEGDPNPTSEAIAVMRARRRARDLEAPI